MMNTGYGKEWWMSIQQLHGLISISFYQSELLGGVPIPGCLVVVRVAAILLVAEALDVAVLKVGKILIIFIIFTYSLCPFIGLLLLLLFRHFCSLLFPAICRLSASNVGKGQEELVKCSEGKVDKPKEHL